MRRYARDTDEADAAERFSALSYYHAWIALSVLAAVVFVVCISVAVGLAVTSTSTPPPPTVFGAWSTWSGWCYELAAGDYKQTRTRVVNNTTSNVVSDQWASRPCVTDSCLVWQATTFSNLTCHFNTSTNQCINGSYTLTQEFYCSTNTTNFTAYLASQTPFSVAVYPTYSSRCIPECPLTNTSVTTPTPAATPVPSPAPNCSYTHWSEWSVICSETSPGVYEQTRIRLTNQSYCTEQREYQTCDPAACVASTIYQLDAVHCIYDASGECIGSSFERRLTQVCPTDAPDFDAYVAASGFTHVESLYLASNSTCDPACPRTGTPAIPSPSVTPSSNAPIVCANSTVDLPWSQSCDEVVNITFKQWRLRSDPANDPSCPVYYDYQDCSLSTCTLVGFSGGSIFCYYNASHLCYNASRQEGYYLQCMTNSTGNNYQYYYRVYAPVAYGNIFGPNMTCPPECPLTWDTDATDYYFLNPPNLNITSGIACAMPEYFDSTTESCALCEAPDACSTAYVDFTYGECVQVPKCNDGNPCTLDLCNNGVCWYPPIAQNALNTTLQQVCYPATGILVVQPTNNAPIIVITSCDDGNPNTVDNYNLETQQCTSTTIPPPVPPPQNASTCNAPVYVNTDALLTSATLGFHGNTNSILWRCGPDGTDVCYDGECRNPADIVGEHCDFQFTVRDVLDDRLYTRTATVDDLCPASTILGQQLKSCSPYLCKNTRTSCAYCSFPIGQGEISLSSALACSCCHTNSDCAPGFICSGLTAFRCI